jgi:hypothetical protein
MSEEEDDLYKGNMKYMSKNEIVKNYLKKTSKDYIEPLEFDQSFDICKDCNIEMTVIHSAGLIRCLQCGRQEEILIDSDKPSYKDPPREMSYFAYKRINHYNEYRSVLRKVPLKSPIINLLMKVERMVSFFQRMGIFFA